MKLHIGMGDIKQRGEMMVKVMNLLTGEEIFYSGITPEEAVVAAYEQSNGRNNTWEYAKKLHLVTRGKRTVAMGDFAAML